MSLWTKIRNSLGGSSADAGIRREIEEHIQMCAEDLIANGMPPQEAMREARRRFGNRLTIQEDTRQARLLPALEAMARDLRLAARSLRKRPGLLAVATLSLALGIGANAVMFSAMDAILWKPLPVADPDRVVEIVDFRNGQFNNGNPARARDYAERLRSIQSLAGHYGEQMVAPGPKRIATLRTFGPLLRTLGYQPSLGRAFNPEEERGATPVAILTHRFWMREYSGGGQALGGALRTASGVYTIIGVLPESAAYPRDIDAWIPAAKDMQSTGRAAAFIQMTARMRGGVTPALLDAELRTVNAALAQQYPEFDKGIQARTLPFRDSSAAQAERPITLAWIAVAVVLLIACLNIASLLLARGMERQREATIRASLGASQLALLRTYLAESLLLAAAGGLAGLLLAAWGIELAAGFLPSENPMTIDARVVLFTLGASLACAVLFGILPAWQTARAGRSATLNQLTRSTGSVKRLWWRGAMVAGQAALCVVLLAGAGILLRSLQNQTNAPLGFTPDSLTVAKINLSWDTPPAQLHAFIRDSLTRLQAIPGVEAAAVTDRLPLEGEAQSGEIVLRGQALDPSLAQTKVHNRTASPSYLNETLRVPLLAGRMFQVHPQRHEAVVNQAFARRFFPTANPVGQAFAYGRQKKGSPPQWIEITGVTGNLRQQPNETAPEPEFYHAPENSYWPMLSFVVRSRQSGYALSTAIRDVFRQVDSGQIVESIAPVRSGLDSALDRPRAMTILAIAFAAIALTLALIGVYGLMASDVAQRTREFGIRLALGASRAEVLRASLRRGATLTIAGIALGSVLAWFAGRLLTGLVYDVEPGDPRFTLAAAALLLLAALAAAFRPAWRGAQTDPAVTLRHE